MAEKYVHAMVARAETERKRNLEDPNVDGIKVLSGS
jgi:hypothetical protein